MKIFKKSTVIVLSLALLFCVAQSANAADTRPLIGSFILRELQPDGSFSPAVEGQTGEIYTQVAVGLYQTWAAEAALIVALYDGSRLLDVCVDSQVLSYNTPTALLSAGVTVENPAYRYVSYLWDNTSGIRPIEGADVTTHIIVRTGAGSFEAYWSHAPGVSSYDIYKVVQGQTGPVYYYLETVTDAYWRVENLSPDVHTFEIRPAGGGNDFTLTFFLPE